MIDTVVIGGEINLFHAVDGDCSLITCIDGEVGTFFSIYPDVYTGPTTVTPSEETQILYTNGRTVPANITVEPIPDNYGRIAWNGSVLRVY